MDNNIDTYQQVEQNNMQEPKRGQQITSADCQQKVLPLATERDTKFPLSKKDLCGKIRMQKQSETSYKPTTDEPK
jgi:hypothetical protein